MTHPSQKRGRGRPAVLGTAQIIEAARILPPETLSMKAVADELGVDPKALSYHITDRNGLFRLVAADAFKIEANKLDWSTSTSWHAALASFGYAVFRSVIATGSLAIYLDVDAVQDIDVLRPAEEVLDLLVRAGFSDSHAAAAVFMVTQLAMTSAQSVVRSPRTYQANIIRTALQDENKSGSVPTMNRILANSDDLAPEDQFSFSLETCIAGLQQRLISTEQEQTDG